MLKAKNWNGEQVNWVTRKYDGYRVWVKKDSYGNVTAKTERKDITEQVRHNAWFKNVITRVPNDTLLEGELVGGNHATDVSRALATGARLDLIVFAIPSLEHTEILHVLNDLCAYWYLTFTQYRPFAKDDIAVRLLDSCRSTGWEGVVLKVANYVGWYKLKVENTCEAFVTGFIDGKGKHLGLIGSLRVSVLDGEIEKEIATVGGFTDSERVEIEEDLDMRRVCEVKYQNVGANGRLRHPRFVRWRNDRRAEQCFVRQIECT